MLVNGLAAQLVLAGWTLPGVRELPRLAGSGLVRPARCCFGVQPRCVEVDPRSWGEAEPPKSVVEENPRVGFPDRSSRDLVLRRLGLTWKSKRR